MLWCQRSLLRGGDRRLLIADPVWIDGLLGELFENCLFYSMIAPHGRCRASAPSAPAARLVRSLPAAKKKCQGRQKPGLSTAPKEVGTMVMGGSWTGWVWMVPDDSGWVWMARDDYGWFWMSMDGYRWLWMAMGGYALAPFWLAGSMLL